ncbi:protein phosphatase 1 regulatory subunit 3B-like [Clytia hemisphaerica]|uniref:CBM21 domain-containing protein n=1 Tax=Clytia hemisphaerica TaxID=252671 RepID=A0A7M5WW27_9CNID
MVEFVVSECPTVPLTKTQHGHTVISKDTLDIKTRQDPAILPLKSCIQIPNPDGSGEKLNIKKAKSVHFADSLGKPLKSVKTLCDLEDDLDLLFLGLKTNYSSTRRSFPVRDKKTSQKFDFVNFKPPITEPNFLERVQKGNVLLENIFVKDNKVLGTVNVKNISFEKDVSITYTLNDWETVQNARGKYVPGSSTGTIDIFSFEITFPEDTACNIKFAICYKAAKKEFWDSNESKNYILAIKTKSPKKKLIDDSDNFNGFIISKQNFIGWAS